MEFYLTNVKSGDRLRIPIAPDRLSIKSGALSTSFTIIKKGETKIPRGTSVAGYSWNGVFPAQHMAGYSFVFDWQQPQKIVSLILQWQENGDTIRLLVTELSINVDVFIESFTYEYYGVGDCAYTINLAVRRELVVETVPAPTINNSSAGTSGLDVLQTGIVKTDGGNLNVHKEPSTSSTVIGSLENGSSVVILGKDGNWYIVPHPDGVDGKGYCYSSYIVFASYSGGGDYSDSSSSSSSGSGSGSGSSGKSGNKSGNNGSSGNYTVRSGDTLFAIAKAMLGDGNRWYEIYNMNKAAIDEVNKGKIISKYTIYAGMVLKLPEKKATAATSKSSNIVSSKNIQNVVSKVSSGITAAKNITSSKPSSKVIASKKLSTKASSDSSGKKKLTVSTSIFSSLIKK